MRIILLAFLFLFNICQNLNAQQQQDSLDKRKLKKLILVESIAYTAGMTGLGLLWYQDGESQSFQFFNDNDQWLQMDKAGHVYTAYHLTDLNYQYLKSTRVKPKKAMLYSSISSTVMMLPIEIFDGFSKKYGASWPDAFANTIGAFLPYQQFLFDENYIYPKFSFSPSPYASLRPNTLGKNIFEQLIKDYNGQTYWLSTDLNIFSSTNSFPPWLQFSVGYSGNNMVFGSFEENLAEGYVANRQWLLSLDMNLSKIEVEQKWLKTIFNLINRVKIPFPALEWDGNNVALHPLYF